MSQWAVAALIAWAVLLRAPVLGAGAVTPIPAEWVPALEEVAVIRLSLGAPVTAEEAPQPLYPSNPGQRITIAYLLDRLADARLSAGDISPPSRVPQLLIGLRSGSVVTARPAYDCTPFDNESGHGYTCRPAPGELIMQIAGGHEVRVSNPAVAAWLAGGWRREVPVGPVPDLDRETVMAIARDFDDRAEWKATFHEEYPLEGPGGTDLRRTWVIEAEYPTGHTVRLLIEAQTGEVMRAERLETLE